MKLHVKIRNVHINDDRSSLCESALDFHPLSRQPPPAPLLAATPSPGSYPFLSSHPPLPAATPLSQQPPASPLLGEGQAGPVRQACQLFTEP